jgi:hypothetical protein
MHIKILYAKAIIFLVALFFTVASNGQTKGLGTWSLVNAKVTFNYRLSAFFEAQVRSQKFFNHFSYHEYKGGVGLNFKKQLAIVLAMGQYVTYSSDGNFKSPVQNSEFRLWQQFTMNNNVGRFKVEHRYRSEQRFTSAGYRNRFRYRTNLIVPFNKLKVEKGALYASLFDEIFLTNKAPYFERNRFYTGLGYQFSDVFSLQMGLLHQFDYRSNTSSVSKNYFQTSLLFNINEKRSERERHPGSMD